MDCGLIEKQAKPKPKTPDHQGKPNKSLEVTLLSARRSAKQHKNETEPYHE